MKVSGKELAAIREVVRLGSIYGYGNLMSHLSSAWAQHLVDTYQMDESSAKAAAHGLALPLKMHSDIITRGEWDETGEAYR